MMPMVYVGEDSRERDAMRVCLRSMRAATADPMLMAMSLELENLRARGLYARPTERRGGQLWDVISGAPMSTEFAISRFLVPVVADYRGWALFMDCDMLIRADLAELFALADPAFAVQVVKHNHRPAERMKMDGQYQLDYPRKNWSSVILWNCGHPANAALDLIAINSLPGRDLHRFFWLADELIGELPREWNHLVGVDAPDPGAKIAHFTLGIPRMAGYEDCEFADEWRALCPA